MITFKKGEATKLLSEGSSLIKKLLADGWIEVIAQEEVVVVEKPTKKSTKKDIENAEFSATSN